MKLVTWEMWSLTESGIVAHSLLNNLFYKGAAAAGMFNVEISNVTVSLYIIFIRTFDVFDGC